MTDCADELTTNGIAESTLLTFDFDFTGRGNDDALQSTARMVAAYSQIADEPEAIAFLACVIGTASQMFANCCGCKEAVSLLTAFAEILHGSGDGAERSIQH